MSLTSAHVPEGLEIPQLPMLPAGIDPVLNAMSIAISSNRDWRDLTIAGFAQELDTAQRTIDTLAARAADYRQLLLLALDELHKRTPLAQRELREAHDRLDDENRRLRAALLNDLSSEDHDALRDDVLTNQHRPAPVTAAAGRTGPIPSRQSPPRDVSANATGEAIGRTPLFSRVANRPPASTTQPHSPLRRTPPPGPSRSDRPQLSRAR